MVGRLALQVVGGVEEATMVAQEAVWQVDYMGDPEAAEALISALVLLL